MSVVMDTLHGRRHSAPRFHQRGEGSRACRSRAVAKCPMHPRSLARLKSAALRDDAVVRGTNAGVRNGAVDRRMQGR